MSTKSYVLLCIVGVTWLINTSMFMHWALHTTLTGETLYVLATAWEIAIGVHAVFVLLCARME